MKTLEITDHMTGETLTATSYDVAAAEIANWYRDSMDTNLAEILQDVEHGRIDNDLLRAVLHIEINETP